MIIPNGTLEFFVVSKAGGLDADGYPVAATGAYGPAVPCQFSYAERSFRAEDEQGERVISQRYAILMEQFIVRDTYRNIQITTSLGGVYVIGGGPYPTAERIRLKDLLGNTIGEFPVRNYEPLEAVCQLRITV